MKIVNEKAMEKLAKLEGVTDQEILSLSSGEVKKIGYEGIAHSTIDINIFGTGLDEGVGHIVLPYPIVNAQYRFGTDPVLQSWQSAPPDQLDQTGMNAIVGEDKGQSFF